MGGGGSFHFEDWILMRKDVDYLVDFGYQK